MNPINFPQPIIVLQPDPIAFVELNGMNLEFLSDAEKNNPQIVIAAFRENKKSFKFASFPFDCK